VNLLHRDIENPAASQDARSRIRTSAQSALGEEFEKKKKNMKMRSATAASKKACSEEKKTSRRIRSESRSRASPLRRRQVTEREEGAIRLKVRGKAGERNPGRWSIFRRSAAEGVGRREQGYWGTPSEGLIVGSGRETLSRPPHYDEGGGKKKKKGPHGRGKNQMLSVPILKGVPGLDCPRDHVARLSRPAERNCKRARKFGSWGKGGGFDRIFNHHEGRS